ncbi:methyltransferase domain-containing protein [Candidatus Chloroploca sp. M-50]|uniref:Methyltransferase domain-containing protein n=1 Tax=Candidatus Chloroploca mongolica TaxID=2528176 RepID=A0ABS4DCZ0_9CHLR|nr:methyltransferase domain-containing protein [Candidatus Chloroploca mongolica]MBP1467315.1 methyltransferase domain-containing protein [Candidatus Chloroploca mongolica]
MTMLKTLLQHPLTRGLDIDDPDTTTLRRQIIANKPFLRRIYQEWYATIADAIPPPHGFILELGSGAGFLTEYIPDLITSDVFLCPHVDAVLNGYELPFQTGSLRAIVMTNVFHHLAQPRRFFHEATRCVRPDGVIVMIEPWLTPWSHWIYTHLHHEPFDPEATSWEFPSSGPLSGANGALPWIVFQRDRKQLSLEFPQWQVHSLTPLMPVRYLLSGGISLRSLMPGWSFTFWRSAEQRLNFLVQRSAMFVCIVLKRNVV